MRAPRVPTLFAEMTSFAETTSFAEISPAAIDRVEHAAAEYTAAAFLLDDCRRDPWWSRL
jgi:hypothetical protein